MAEELFAVVAFAALAIAAAGYIVQRIGLPAVFGYLVAGIALSPFVVGQSFFPVHTLEQVSEVGVLLLLFLIGAELDLGRLRETVRKTAVALPFDVLLPMVGAATVARAVGWSFTEAIALGASVALSSTLIGERLTSGVYGSGPVRPRVIGVLISEDVAAAGLLTFLAVLGSGAIGSAEGGLAVALSLGKLLFLLTLLTAAALLVVPRILDEVARRHVHELLVLWALALIALWGYLGNFAGSAELGAFVAGVAAAEAGAQYVTRNALQGLRDTAVALFFFTSGLVTDFGPVLADPWTPMLVAMVFLAAKFMVHVPAAAAAGLSPIESVRTAFALGTLGEFSLILVAVADRQGIAHPALQPTVIGAMLIVLPISAVLLRFSSSIARSLHRLPAGIRRPLAWLQRGLQGVTSDRPQDAGRRRAVLRILASNLVLLVALGLAGGAVITLVVDYLGGVDPFLVRAVGWGILLALSLPLWRGAFRAYRDLVWLMVGLRPGERVGAGRVRVMLVDATVAATAALVLGLVTLRLPATLPILLVAITIAAGLGFVAWRRLTAFHRTLEDTMARVLGRDDESAQLLDRLLQQYPWGVRSSAVAVPSDSPVARRTVQGSRISALTGAIVAVIHRRGKEIVNPPPETLILPGDTLVLMGDTHQLARAEGLIVAHGEAIRMTAQSRQAAVHEVEITEHSDWVGQTLAEADVRAATGTLVAGIWPAGNKHPMPYTPSWRLSPGDHLLVLGTPLQVERVRARAAPRPMED